MKKCFYLKKLSIGILQKTGFIKINLVNERSDAMFGRPSLSHLQLVLSSWANGAEWKLDDETNMIKLLNSDGTSHNAAVAACDEGL